jgi:pyruvate/2-oxoglutarate dehydrogenase complex dihydrolipoamide acyltransferase (E2) component
MSTEVRFPKMTDAGGASGVLATWYVEDGEQVSEGQVLADVAVEKVDAEVTAPVAGTVTRAVDEEAEVAEGSVIATIA